MMLDSSEQRTSQDNLERLEELLPKLAPALEQKHLGVALVQAEAALKPFEPQLQQLEALTEAATILWPYLDASRRDLEDITDELEELAGEMEAAGSQYELSGVAKSYPNVSQKYIPRYNRTLMAMVSRYSTRELSSLGALGRLLGKIGQPQLAQKLQALELDAKRLEHTSPSLLADGIRSIQARKVAAQAEVTALASDPEVDDFLVALSKSQCTLAHVTPKVLHWLDTVNARGQFKVLSA